MAAKKTVAGSSNPRRIGPGAEYVDVEAAAAFAPDLTGARAGRGVVVSSHLFGHPPADLEARYSETCVRPAPKWPSWRFRCRRSRRRCRCSIWRRHIQTSLATGTSSSPWAIRASRHECLRRASGIAGRLPAMASRQAKCRRPVSSRDFRFRRIAADAAVYAVVGNPIIHSPVAGHAQRGLRRAGAERGLCAARGARRRRFRRFAAHWACVAPASPRRSRSSLMPRADEIDPLARPRGRDQHRSRFERADGLAANTDVEGFLAPLASTGSRSKASGSPCSVRAGRRAQRPLRSPAARPK